MIGLLHFAQSKRYLVILPCSWFDILKDLTGMCSEEKDQGGKQIPNINIFQHLKELKMFDLKKVQK